ncbi:TPA: LysE family translocator [Pseudomonas aeruginosa]
MDTSAFLIALAVVYLVPGPDMLLLFQTGARQGRRAALVTALGLALARACHVLMAATGLALLFRTAPWTFELVRLLGAAYLAWLGLQMLRGGGLAFDCAYALAGGRLGRWLASRPRAQRLQQWGFGGLLIGFGVRLALLRQL